MVLLLVRGKQLCPASPTHAGRLGLTRTRRTCSCTCHRNSLDISICSRKHLFIDFDSLYTTGVTSTRPALTDKPCPTYQMAPKPSCDHPRLRLPQKGRLKCCFSAATSPREIRGYKNRNTSHAHMLTPFSSDAKQGWELCTAEGKGTAASSSQGAHLLCRIKAATQSKMLVFLRFQLRDYKQGTHTWKKIYFFF